MAVPLKKSLRKTRADFDRDRVSANTLAPGGNWRDMLHVDQIDALEKNLNGHEKDMPRTVDYIVGRKKAKDSKEDKSRVLRAYMPFAGRALYSSNRIDAALLPAVRDIYAKLVANSPFLTGAYRKHFRYLVDGTLKPTVNKSDIEEGEDIIGVTNTMVYASTLENPKWPRPFGKTYAWANRKFSGKYDVRIRYTRLARATTKDPRYQYAYFHPVIEIAPAGRMGRFAGKQFKRRRSSKQRLNRAGVG